MENRRIPTRQFDRAEIDGDMHANPQQLQQHQQEQQLQLQQHQLQRQHHLLLLQLQQLQHRRANSLERQLFQNEYLQLRQRVQQSMDQIINLPIQNPPVEPSPEYPPNYPPRRESSHNKRSHASAFPVDYNFDYTNEQQLVRNQARPQSVERGHSSNSNPSPASERESQRANVNVYDLSVEEESTGAPNNQTIAIHDTHDFSSDPEIPFPQAVHLYASLSLKDVDNFVKGNDEEHNKEMSNNAENGAGSNNDKQIWLSSMANAGDTWAQLTKRMVEADLAEGSERWILPLSKMNASLTQKRVDGEGINDDVNHETNNSKFPGHFLCYGNGFATYLLPVDRETYHSIPPSQQLDRLLQTLPIPKTGSSSPMADIRGVFFHLCASEGIYGQCPPAPDSNVLGALEDEKYSYRGSSIVEWKVRLLDLDANEEIERVVQLNLEVGDLRGDGEDVRKEDEGDVMVVDADGTPVPAVEEKDKIHVLMYTTKTKNDSEMIDEYCMIPWKEFVHSISGQDSENVEDPLGVDVTESANSAIMPEDSVGELQRESDSIGQQLELNGVCNDIHTTLSSDAHDEPAQPISKGIAPDSTNNPSVIPKEEPKIKKKRVRKSINGASNDILTTLSSDAHDEPAQTFSKEIAPDSTNNPSVLPTEEPKIKKKRVRKSKATENPVSEHGHGENHPEADGKKVRKRKPKDPNAPKKNIGTYAFYMKHNRKLVSDANPGMDAKEVTKAVARHFKEMNSEELAKYTSMAVRDKERYQEDLKLYNQQKEHEVANNTGEVLEKGEANEENSGSKKVEAIKPAERKNSSVIPLGNGPSFQQIKANNGLGVSADYGASKNIEKEQKGSQIQISREHERSKMASNIGKSQNETKSPPIGNGKVKIPALPTTNKSKSEPKLTKQLQRPKLPLAGKSKNGSTSPSHTLIPTQGPALLPIKKGAGPNLSSLPPANSHSFTAMKANDNGAGVLGGGGMSKNKENEQKESLERSKLAANIGKPQNGTKSPPTGYAKGKAPALPTASKSKTTSTTHPKNLVVQKPKTPTANKSKTTSTTHPTNLVVQKPKTPTASKSKTSSTTHPTNLVVQKPQTPKLPSARKPRNDPTSPSNSQMRPQSSPLPLAVNPKAEPTPSVKPQEAPGSPTPTRKSTRVRKRKSFDTPLRHVLLKKK